MADKFRCPDCFKDVMETKTGLYRVHKGLDGGPCDMAGAEIPAHVREAGPADPNLHPDEPVENIDYARCQGCTRRVKLTRLGYFEPHNTTLRGGERCPKSGTRNRTAATAEPAQGKEETSAPQELALSPHASGVETLASVEEVSEKLANLPDVTVEMQGELIYSGPGPAPSVDSSASTESNSPESSSSTPETSSGQSTQCGNETTTSSAAPEELALASEGPFRLGVNYSDTISQPWSHILQPSLYTGPFKPEPMEGLAAELATKIKETFYAYQNRKTSDNRGAQTTLGPSEIGTPCDRRLAMALMNIPAVNPGGDGWASFVGTCGHEGMADVYRFADAGSGRYAVELPVYLGIPTVPRGTTDLLDRRDGTVIDWKFMGEYSLKKFKKEGPSDTYRVQAQVYGLGAERSGEQVRNVAVVGLPRAGGSLDQMHVWTEGYDRKFAQDALGRVEKIARSLDGLEEGDRMRAASFFDTADSYECRYCPYHLKGDKEMIKGCPGP